MASNAITEFFTHLCKFQYEKAKSCLVKIQREFEKQKLSTYYYL